MPALTKGYIHVRPDLANKAALTAAISASPTAYHKGSIWILADGSIHYSNAATTVLTITAT